MLTIKQLLESKGQQVWSINADAAVFEALRMMAEKSIGALVVMNEGKLVGIVSERDYARKVILAGRSSHDTPVSEIMSSTVWHALPDQPITDAMSVMTEKRVRHLPVLEDGAVVGMISIGDLVKAIMAEQEYVISQMEHYITGAMA